MAAYVVTAPNVEVTSDQVADFPEDAGQAVRELVEEYEARESQEARLAKDADKLECLIQAREYQAQGHEDVPPWIETSAAALQSPSARRLAEACKKVPPRQWWKAFADSYPKPLKTAGRPSTGNRASTRPRPASSEPEEAHRA
jgi:putative hydrolase of HD superfamily